jgi:hypothetical protein
MTSEEVVDRAVDKFLQQDYSLGIVPKIQDEHVTAVA